MNIDRSEVGFNVIGYVSANVGLGVAARNLVSLLLEKGIAVAVYDVDAGLGRSKHDNHFESITVKAAQDLPYDINLFICDPVSLGLFLCWENVPVFGRNRLNVGVIFWELPVLSDSSKNALKLLDVILCVSDFVRYIVEFNVGSVRTIAALQPLFLPSSVPACRQQLQLPHKKVVFISSFDPSSDWRRKNPLAIVEAFEQACLSDDRGYLVLKLNNAHYNGDYHESVNRILARCRKNPNIRVVAESFSYADVLKLYASCDVFVSLHRAEGLGLGLMEAMSLGKPVIATAWSGNMSFMNHTNACLVGCDLTQVDATVKAYTKAYLGRDAQWAEPRVDEAVIWMRRLMGDSDLRARIGAKAARDMAAYQDRARNADFVEDLGALREQRMVMRDRSVEKTQRLGLLREQIDSTYSQSLVQRWIGVQRMNYRVKRLLNRHVLWRFNKRPSVNLPGA